jgi:AcrR family transcriptional regulator
LLFSLYFHQESMGKTIEQTASLKEACVQAAREVIAEKGVENLSMRDVARKLGISHQAPYRHFARPAASHR